MGKQNELRKRLKASDKRRQRRASIAQNDEPAVSVSVDVTGMLVEAIVQRAQHDPAVVDAAAIAALRAFLNGGKPAGRSSRSLLNDFEMIAARDDVQPRPLRTAAHDLLQLAKSRQADDCEANSFLQYLALLTA